MDITTSISMNEYMSDFLKTLKNFCLKSPLQPTITASRETGDIMLHYTKYENNEVVELPFKVSPLENKKSIIARVKAMMVKDYPVVYGRETIVLTPAEIDKKIEEGMSLDDALLQRKHNYYPRYKIIRVHHATNALDVYDFHKRSVSKFKLKIPVITLLSSIRTESKEDVSYLFYENATFIETIEPSEQKEAGSL